MSVNVQGLKRLGFGFALIATVSMGGVHPLSAQELKGLTIGSGSVGGDFFILGTALQQVVSKAYPNAKIENSATAGSVENLRLLRKKEIDVGILAADSPPVVNAWRGEGGFKDERPYQEIRALIGFFHFTYNVLTRKDSGIKTYADLKGKRVGIGPDPALNDPFYSPFIEANGINYKNDINRVYASYADIFRMLKEGRVDASVGWTSGFKIPASIQELQSATPIRWMSMDPEALRRANLEPVVFPAGTLQEEATTSVKLGFVVVGTTNALLDNVAYAFAKAVHQNFSHLAEMQPAIRQGVSDPSTLTAKAGPLPYHPGAIRYWKEAGLWKD
ncbi:MAG: TAXI family TRAP transporter solute-binding subunit [Pseudomonadota bacterium]